MANTLTISTQLTYAKMQGYMPAFTAAARQTGINRNLLLAVASRESAMGLALNSLWLGDGGDGIGLMQIDRDAHPVFAATHSPRDNRANVMYGANYLRKQLNHYGGNLHYALAAYNCGRGNVADVVNAGLPPDACTTGNDYGQDVLERYHILQQLSGTSANDSGHQIPALNPRPEDRAEKLIFITGGSLLASIGIAVYIAAQNNEKLENLSANRRIKN